VKPIPPWAVGSNVSLGRLDAALVLSLPRGPWLASVVGDYSPGTFSSTKLCLEH
jgi:hypothetical protein